MVVPHETTVTETVESPRARREKTRVSFAFPPPGKGRPAAYLICTGGAAKGKQFAIEQVVYRIGSGNENELHVSDDYVSGTHAAIRYDSGGLYLTDRGSRNGTFLNEAKLGNTAMALTPGDHIRVGRTTFKLAGEKSQAEPSDEINRDETIVP